MSNNLVEIVNLPQVNDKLIMYGGYRSFVQLSVNDKNITVLEYSMSQSHNSIVEKYLTSQEIPFEVVPSASYNQRKREAERKSQPLPIEVNVPRIIGKNYTIWGAGRIFMNLPARSFYSPNNEENEYRLEVNPVHGRYLERALLDQGWKHLK